MRDDDRYPNRSDQQSYQPRRFDPRRSGGSVDGWPRGSDRQWRADDEPHRSNNPADRNSPAGQNESGRSPYDAGMYGQSGYGSDDGRYGLSGRRQGEPDVTGYRGDRGYFERAGDEMASWFGDDEAARRRRQDAREGDEGAQHHGGRGPRNYQRSDDRIREDVNDRLTDDREVDASDIEVSVQSREVTLNGSVNSRYEKRRAEDVTEHVSGVSHVQNNLRIKQNGSMLATGVNGDRP